MGKKLFQESFNTSPSQKSLSHAILTAHKEVCISQNPIQVSLAHHDILMQKHQSQLIFKQRFKTRFLKQGSIKKKCVYPSVFFPFTWPIIAQSFRYACNILSEQLSASVSQLCSDFSMATLPKLEAKPYRPENLSMLCFTTSTTIILNCNLVERHFEIKPFLFA